MEFFHVTQDFSFSLPFEDGNQILLSLKKPEGKPDLSSIYFSTGACIETLKSVKSQNIPKDFKIKILNTQNKKKIYGMDGFPKVLSNFDGTLSESDYRYSDPVNYKKIPTTKFVPLEKQIEDIDGDEIKVLLINGLGTGLGDGMAGLAALNVFYKKLQKKYKKITIDTMQPAVIGDKSHQSLYSQESVINSLTYLPTPVEKLLEYDLVMDNSAMIIRESFPDQSMVDFFLENLGIDPKTVSQSEKRIFIKTSERAAEILKTPLTLLRQDPKKKLIMLHTSSSTVIRSMPRDIIKKVIKQILDVDQNNIVITWDKIDDIKDELNKYLGNKKDRHINLSFKNTGFDLYTYMISQMDALVTVDTSSYHIADAFDVPTVVIFQTIDPKLRISNYPLCSAVEITKKNDLKGVHVSMDTKHIDKMRGYWGVFDTKKIINELVSVMIKKRMYIADKKNYINCPICNHENNNKPVDRLGIHELYNCNNCKSEFSKDRSVTNYDELYKDEYKHYLEDIDSKEIMKKTMSQLRFEPYVDFIHSIPATGKKFLDIGCANGFMVQYSKNLGFDSYGIDASKLAIEFAKKKFELNDNVYCTDKIELPNNFPEQFDIITSIEVLENVQDPIQFAKDVYSKLKPGGYWFISTHNRNRIQFACGSKNTTKHIGLERGEYPLEYLQRFRQETHNYLMNAAGFEIVNQNSSRIAPETVYDIVGQMPAVTMNLDNKVVEVPQEGLKAFIANLYQPVLDGTKGLGSHINTIAKKPNR